MQYIADLHIHSPFSRATSKASDLPGLFSWAQVKGINVVGTGDFTHPGWYGKLKELLTPAEPGLFRLKDENIPTALAGTAPENIPTRFMLSAEISSIYKRHGKVRKVHNILYVPDFTSAEKINAKLAGIGNIESDGRPILGLDSRNLLEILLEEAPEGFLVPAHIWTPWFSLFGSKSGFDSMEECFGDLSQHIFAVETGLSSDPEMNRRISALDRYALISNSDCHSPAKLGRESNIFATEFSYFGIREALKNPLGGQFKATIEFFPEEGKYHCDGHRKCNVCLEPRQTRDLDAVCPVCNRPLTVGVLHRVMELADREQPFFPAGSPGVHSLIPLPEVLGEIIGSGPATKGVMELYTQAVKKFGSEFNIYLNTPVEEINRLSPVLGEAVDRMRHGRVIRQPGFDGEFGVIRVFEEGELATLSGQISLFTGKKPRKAKQYKKEENYSLPIKKKTGSASLPSVFTKNKNSEQERAVTSSARHVVVTAGPGTGKTFTLIQRVQFLINAETALPGKCAVITFTNRTAEEIKDRLINEIGSAAQEIFVGTFHRFCLEWLRKENKDLQVLGDEARMLLLKNSFPEESSQETKKLESKISDYLFRAATSENTLDEITTDGDVRRYLDTVKQSGMVDLEMIIPLFVQRLRQNEAFRRKISDAVQFLLVDEFQDLNHSQFALVKEISSLGTHIFAIGDPDQAIYGFRGSDLRFFTLLAEAPETETLVLGTNYRSAPEILQVAAALIKGNSPTRERKDLVATSQTRGTISFFQAPTAEAEAEQVVKKIEEAMGGISNFSLNTGRGGSTESELSFSDIAVLYRLSSQAEVLTEALSRRGIPYQLVGAKPFYLNPSIRSAFFFLQLNSPEPTLDIFLALLKGIIGIGSATLGHIEKGLPLRGNDFFPAALKLPLPSGSHEIILRLQREFIRFNHTVSELGIAQALKNALPFLDINEQDGDLQRLLDLASAFGTNLPAFVEHLANNAKSTVYDERAEAIALMTMHASKGLEFPIVFITGIEEGIIPCSYGSREFDIEEERRLLYVAMTRAKETLYLSSAASRVMFGRQLDQKPSRFLDDLPKDLILQETVSFQRKKKPVATQMKLF